MDRLRHTSILFIAILFIGNFHTTYAQNGPPKHVQQAIQELKTFFTSNSDAAISSFIDQSIVPSEDVDQQQLAKRLRDIKTKINNRWKNVAIRPDSEGILLIFSDRNPIIHLKVILDQNGIYDLHFVDPPEPITFTKTNIGDVFGKLAAKGFSGVAYFQIDGDVLYKQGFGMANKSLDIANTTETIFAIGSRPIDFTKASIYLLEQQGTISQDDTIDQYFEDVPSDKQTMTIRHLMSGQSGLPDFFDTQDDWDPDLAWINHETAEQRILSEELLFEPGTDRRHSHAAFGLLAALVERVSGQSYVNFLDDYFFEPAGMNHTNEYGVAADHELKDFAVGYGSQSVGLPNIPPNWGPTSWLIKGSGGMYSTLGDLLKFYDFMRSGEVLDDEHHKPFEQPSVNLDGSVRGFELFSVYLSNGNQAYIFLNNPGDRQQMRTLFRAAEEFILNQKK